MVRPCATVLPLNPKQNALNPWRAVKPAYAYACFFFSFFYSLPFLKDITAPRQRRLARRVTSGKGLKQKANSSRSTKAQVGAALQELLGRLPDRMWRETMRSKCAKTVDSACDFLL